MFITIEGIAGSGKTTQAHLLARNLEACGYEVEQVRDPGGTDVCEAIRSLLYENEIDRLAALMLFEASRRILFAEKIRPALDEGKFVICDRFTDSTLAYQHYAFGINKYFIEGIHKELRIRVPDLTFILDIDPFASKARLELRNPGDGNAMYLGGLLQAASGYREMARLEPERIIPVRAELPRDLLEEIMFNKVIDRISSPEYISNKLKRKEQ
jgi:dTMP kinase